MVGVEAVALALRELAQPARWGSGSLGGLAVVYLGVGSRDGAEGPSCVASLLCWVTGGDGLQGTLPPTLVQPMFR